MGFKYSIFSDSWFTMELKEDGEGYGTVYYQEGVNGTTNPCSGGISLEKLKLDNMYRGGPAPI
jgi:hypothetical protein